MLRFLEEDSWYEKKKFTIVAIVSRPMGNNDQPTGSVSTGIIAGVIGVNLLVSTAAVIFPSREIVRGYMMQEINE